MIVDVVLNGRCVASAGGDSIDPLCVLVDLFGNLGPETCQQMPLDIGKDSATASLSISGTNERGESVYWLGGRTPLAFTDALDVRILSSVSKPSPISEGDQRSNGFISFPNRHALYCLEGSVNGTYRVVAGGKDCNGLSLELVIRRFGPACRATLALRGSTSPALPQARQFLSWIDELELQVGDCVSARFADIPRADSASFIENFETA